MVNHLSSYLHLVQLISLAGDFVTVNDQNRGQGNGCAWIALNAISSNDVSD